MTELQKKALIVIYDLIGHHTVDQKQINLLELRIHPRTFGCLIQKGYIKVEFAGSRIEFKYNVCLTERGIQKVVALKRASDLPTLTERSSSMRDTN